MKNTKGTLGITWVTQPEEACGIPVRLQAVPFWLVERSREISEREKTGRSKQAEGSLGRGGKKGKGKERDCALSCNRCVQGNSAHNSLSPLKIQLKMTANR